MNENISEENKPESDERWQKTHPLTSFQNKVLYISLAVVTIVLAIVVYISFQEMFKSQVQ